MFTKQQLVEAYEKLSSHLVPEASDSQIIDNIIADLEGVV